MNRWLKIGIGIAVAIVVAVALGFWSRTQLQTFFYPVAPPMPAVVSEPMPEILARLESVLKTKAPHVLAGLQPGLSANAVAKLEQQYNVQLPDDIKAIYEWHNGSVLTTNSLNEFVPGHHFMLLEEALQERAGIQPDEAPGLAGLAYKIIAGHRESWICLFNDYAGDGYFFDPKRKPSEGALFYNFNETGTFEFFPSAKNLMAGVAKCYEQDAFKVKSDSSPPELDEDYERSAKIWDEFGAGN